MSGYPPIPRDPSGAPLPVVWDDGLQSWKVYEGLMPLETKLAAIESKLLALDSKFADGSAKVALSGTIIVNPAQPAAWITASSTVSKIEKVKGREASLFVWTDTGMRVKVRGLSGIDKTSMDPVLLGNANAGRVDQFKIPEEVLPADNLELIFENPVDWALTYQYQLVWGV